MKCPVCNDALRHLFTSTYCPTCEGKQANPPSPVEDIIYACDLQGLLASGDLIPLNGKRAYLNQWTWDKFLVGPWNDWIDVLPNKGPAYPVGTILGGIEFFLLPNLFNGEVRIEYRT